MKNLRKKKKRLTSTPTQIPVSPASPDNERALLELRAKGRAVLSEPNAPSFVIGTYGREEFCTKAEINGRIVHREPGEKYETFVDRVARMFPAQGQPGFALMLSDAPAQTDAN